MIPEETKNNLSRTHGGNLHQMHMNSRKSLLSSKHILHEWDMKKMLTQVSNTSLMFNKIMEEIRMLSMGSTTIHPGFLLKGIP